MNRKRLWHWHVATLGPVWFLPAHETWGIMMDDFLAALYATVCALCFLFYFF